MKAHTDRDPACSDPCCSYRAEIEQGYWVEAGADINRFIRALKKIEKLSMDSVYQYPPEGNYKIWMREIHDIAVNVLYSKTK